MVSKVQLGEEGPAFSRLVTGFWRMAEWGHTAQESLAFVQQGLEWGITTTDHADIYGDYGCERLFGEVLALDPSLRSRIQLVTKCDIKLVSGKHPSHDIAHYDTSKAHIIASAETSLRLLRTDYLDVLLLHRPDPLMDADEVAEAFTALRDAGKVRYFGVSNFTPSQFALLSDRLPFPLVTNQVECSVLNFDVMHDGTLDQCQQHHIPPMAWSPLGGGRLFTEDSEQVRRLRTCMMEIGEELRGAGLDQVAFAWLLKHPVMMLPVLGTGKIDRVRAACEAVALSMSRQQWFKIWRASKGHDVP